MSDNTSFDKVVNDLKDKFNTFSNSNRSTYYNFMDFIDNIEELANTVSNNLNSIAEDIDDITNDIVFGDSTINYNDIVNNKHTDKEIKKDENKKETIKINIEKFKEKINSSANECILKLEEIKNIIKDFDYASRKSYEDSCSDLQRSLEEDFNTMKGTKNINEFTERFNKVIEYINNLYRSAYYKKNNKPSLAFLIDNEEDIVFIEKINADEFIK